MPQPLPNALRMSLVFLAPSPIADPRPVSADALDPKGDHLIDSVDFSPIQLAGAASM